MTASVQHPPSPSSICLVRALLQQRARNLDPSDRRNRPRCGQWQGRAVTRVGLGSGTRHMSAEASRPHEVRAEVPAVGLPALPTKVGA